VFTNWATDASGTNYAQSNGITMNGPKTASANWKTQYYITFEVDPQGSGTATPGSDWYDADASPLSITANPAETYRFTSWKTEGSITVEPADEESANATINGPGTITAKFESTLITILNSGFEGDLWDEDWNAWDNPPWYRGDDDAHSGFTSAKSDANYENKGPFTCDPLDATGAKAIHIIFWYKGLYTENGDLKLFYSGESDPYSGPSTMFPWLNDFEQVTGVNIGGDHAWTQISITITDTSAFTSTFRFRFETDYWSFTSTGGELEQIWVDDVVITVDL